MKTLTTTFATALVGLSLSVGAAFAENPNFGRTEVQPTIDQATTASIKSHEDAADNQHVALSSSPRYGDGAPYANR